MMIKENKYHSTIRSEFKELVGGMVNGGRTVFHLYTVHRLLNLGLLIDFQFKYCPNTTEDQYIHMELNLNEWGKVHFQINTQTDYVSIADEEGFNVLSNFYANYDTGLDDKKVKRGLGL